MWSCPSPGTAVRSLEMFFFYIGIAVAIAVGGFAFSDYCDSMVTSLASWTGVTWFVTGAMLLGALLSIGVLYSHPLTNEKGSQPLLPSAWTSDVAAVTVHAVFFVVSGCFALLSAMQASFLWNYTKNDREFQSVINHGFPMTTNGGWGFSVQRKNDLLLTLQLQIPIGLFFITLLMVKCMSAKRTAKAV